MNKIEKLLRELCPNGVEYKELGEVCEIKRGRVISKDYINKNAGIYPVFSSQTVNNGTIGYINTYDYDGTYVTWTTDGAHVGTVFLRKNIKFSVTNICGILSAKIKGIDLAFLAYIFGLEAKKYVVPGMGNPKLMSNVVEKIRIPIPPLQVQQEIVKILDATQELTLRKQQYEYYREQLLSFPKDEEAKVFPYLQRLLDKHNTKKIEWKELGEVCEILVGKDVPKNTMKGQLIPTDRCQFPVYSNGKEVYGYCSTYSVSEEAVTVSARGSIGFVAYRKPFFTPIIRLITIVSKHEIVNTRFLYYRLSIEKFSGSDSSLPQMTSDAVKKIKIPIPPIEVQQEIVKILDTFEELTSSLSSGLPAEIRLRQQQYEYYREKLLTFKELKE